MTQQEIILNMLIDKERVCVTDMMSQFIPDYRRRLCDLKEAGHELVGRPCEQHKHKSRNLKEWPLVQKKSLGVVLPPQQEIDNQIKQLSLV